MDVSIIIPSFNEEQIIADTLTRVAHYVDHNSWLGRCEVIVVAGGSDTTLKLAHSLKPLFAHLKVVEPEPGDKGRGKGYDVRTGFKHASGAVQLFMDADLPTPLHHIKAMVTLLRDGNDMVIGERKVAQIHPSVLRTVLSRLGPLSARLLLRLPYRDTQCGFKGFRKDAAALLFDELETTGWGFDLEVLLRAREAKLRVVSVAVDDWSETRAEGFRGESVLHAGWSACRELLVVRLAGWGRSMARHSHWWFGAASAAAAGIAVHKNIAESIWFDEAFTSGIIHRPVLQLIQSTARDVHPPLYYLLLKGWAHLFGYSIVTLRVFSVLCGAAALFVGLRLVQRLFGARIAVRVIPVAVAAPFLLRYDIEARMYALASLICISATYVLIAALDRARAGQRSTWQWVAYAVLVALGMYTLYYTALIWVVHAVWCLLTTRGDSNTGRGKRWSLLRQPWVWALVASGLLFLPWLPSLVSQLHSVQRGFWIGAPSVDTVTSVFTFALSYSAVGQLDSWASFVFMSAMVAAIYFVSKAWRLVSMEQRRWMLLLTLYASLPVVLLYAASLPPLQPVFVQRYMAHIIIGGYLLLGVSVAVVCRARRTLGNYAAATLLFVTLVGGVVHLQVVGNGHPQAKLTMQYIKSQNPARGTVVFQNSQRYLEAYYYAPHAAWLYPSMYYTDRLALGPIPEPIAPINTRLVWYVYDNSPGSLAPKTPYRLVHTHAISGTSTYVATYTR